MNKLKSSFRFCMQTAGVGLLLIFITSLLSGCDAGLIDWVLGTKSPYQVQSTGLVFANRSFVTPIYWIDNDRALFPAYAEEHVKNENGKETERVTNLGVYIWNTKTNSYVRHADLSEPFWFICFNKGFVAYSIGSDGEDDRGPKLIIKAGDLGKESKLSENVFWKLHPELERCDETKADIRPEHRDGGINYLRAEDGYLYAGPMDQAAGHFTINDKNQNDKIKYFKTGAESPITLPILVKEAFQVEPYSEYAKKYVIIPSMTKASDIHGPGGPWPKDTPKPIYLLSSDGQIETVNVPYGIWQNMNDAYLTAKGLFIVSNATTGEKSRTAGGYLLKNGKIIKLFDHLVEGVGVSPDGCKIAYANNDFNPKTTEYVQIINLCK